MAECGLRIEEEGNRLSWTDPMIPLRLVDLPRPAKVMLTAFLALLGVGYLVSVLNIYEHHQDADLEPGLTLNDLRRVYHGLEKQVTSEVRATTPAPMLRMVAPGGKMRKFLERGGEPAVRVLTSWLEAGAPEADFVKGGRPEPGDPAPRQVIANQCIRCHNAQGDKADVPYAQTDASEPEYELVAKKALPLPGPTTQQTQTVWLAPTGLAELVQITHPHILAIPVLALIVGGLFLLTGLPRGFKAVVGPLPMLAVCFDLGSWWLARPFEPFVYVIAAAGAIFGIAFGAQVLCVFASLWFGSRGTQTQPG